MDVLSLNKVELGECVRPKSGTAEGKRIISCYVLSPERLIIVGTFTDDKVMWYSETGPGHIDTNTKIFNLINETRKEPNREWYATPLLPLLEKVHVPAYCLNKCFKLEFRLEKECYIYRFKKNEYPENIGAEIAKEVAFRVDEARSILQSPRMSDIRAELKDSIKKLEKIYHASSREKLSLEYIPEGPKLVKRINELDFLYLSEDGDTVCLYTDAKNTADRVYNAYMSIVR